MLALASLAALFGAAFGQNTTFTKVAALQNKFYGCVKANSNYLFCTDGSCYNGSAPSNATCTKDFDGNYDNPNYPATYIHTHDINELDIKVLQVVPNQNWLSLKNGETVRMSFRSITEKSAYVDLFYNAVNGGSNNVNKTNNQNVQFLVFNNRLKDVRKFDVSKVDKVLLPQSADTFTVYLAARGADFNITLEASNSIMSRVLGLAAAFITVLAVMF